ncbi:hypothetical protein MTQ93_09650 [Staphylococcus agnetis]|uniref:hypothetical protein n=1 Tax=Staphylococcus agnetis TaxID=985762 RepID=UPI00208F4992|nr:hypothetical protein [Staphylococcus agnetis]MCO4346308.1 hypothetical protein [Staphylococcus agnetis]MCO4360616.1 hypothetical protein [Staphylococcus agnetis]
MENRYLFIDGILEGIKSILTGVWEWLLQTSLAEWLQDKFGEAYTYFLGGGGIGLIILIILFLILSDDKGGRA